MIALTLTCRPHWRSWLMYQLAKQEHPHELVVYDDCVTPQSWPKRVQVVRGLSGRSLGEKRNDLLALVGDQPFAWFDDDDWHPKERLVVAEGLLAGGGIDAVGYEWGTFCDVQTLQTRRLNTGSRVCFNSGVFAPHCAKTRMQPLHRGEDTQWLAQCLKDATIVSSPLMEHCWMSHEGNITGKRGSMSFEGRRWSRFDAWELKFLKEIR